MIDIVTTLATFTGAILGSSVGTALVNYYLDKRRERAKTVINIRSFIANLYDTIHYNQLPANFTATVSEACRLLDTHGYVDTAKSIRAIISSWAAGSVDTTELKQLLYDFLKNA